jgi:hypothetical protein
VDQDAEIDQEEDEYDSAILEENEDEDEDDISTPIDGQPDEGHEVP